MPGLGEQANRSIPYLYSNTESVRLSQLPRAGPGPHSFATKDKPSSSVEGKDKIYLRTVFCWVCPVLPTWTGYQEQACVEAVRSYSCGCSQLEEKWQKKISAESLCPTPQKTQSQVRHKSYCSRLGGASHINFTCRTAHSVCCSRFSPILSMNGRPQTKSPESYPTPYSLP